MIKKDLSKFSLAIHIPCQIELSMKRVNAFHGKPKEYFRRSTFLSCSDAFISGIVGRIRKSRIILKGSDVFLRFCKIMGIFVIELFCLSIF